jgi:hypothetical protein
MMAGLAIAWKVCAYVEQGSSALCTRRRGVAIQADTVGDVWKNKLLIKATKVKRATFGPQKETAMMTPDRRRLVAVTSGCRASSDLKLIVYICYTAEIADMFIPYVIPSATMHGNSKYASDRCMVE